MRALFRAYISDFMMDKKGAEQVDVVYDAGYNCAILNLPSKLIQTECPVCLLVLRKPHLSSCCGHNYCRSCILEVQSNNGPCPLCQKVTFTTMHNKGLERTMKELMVECENKTCGCNWTGVLGKLDDHVDNVCPYTEVLQVWL